MKIVIAHAESEEHLAEALAIPLGQAGYEVFYSGLVLIGESLIEEYSKALSEGGPVILCGTIKSIGTGWAHRLVNAARQGNPAVRIFALQMEEDAYIQQLSLDGCISKYWLDPIAAVRELVVSLEKYYSSFRISVNGNYGPRLEIEVKYRQLALESCDIIDLANLPETDRYGAMRQIELRKLYVSLRVRLQSAAAGDVGDDKAGDRGVRKKPTAWSGEWEDKHERFPVGLRLAESRRIVVLGEPGAGKTTLIRWIATAYLLRLNRDPEWRDLPDVETLPDEDRLPIMIKCRDLHQSAMIDSFEDILTKVLRRAELTESEVNSLKPLFIDKISAGGAILLIDGLDEIIDLSFRVKFCRQIEQVQAAYPDLPIVITSRIVGYREMGYRLGRGFEHLIVADLSKKDREEFVKRWCEISELPERRDSSASELLNDIHSTDRIERLTGNPMLLTSLALVKRKVGRLPTRRADLYWDVLAVLLNWRREVDDSIDHREAIPQLEYIAYAMCDRGVQWLREDEVLALLDKMREEYPQIHPVRRRSSDEFLRFLERRTGILLESGHVRYSGRPVPVFEFRHLTFQEYLAGLALVDGRFPGRDRSKKLAGNIAPLAGKIGELESTDKHSAEVSVAESWREALRLCLASCNDDDVDAALLAILRPIVGEDVAISGRPRAVLAALCLADDPNAGREVACEILKTLVANLNDQDGSGVSVSSVDEAAAQLSRTRWALDLKRLLRGEFESAPDSERGESSGAILGVIMAEDPGLGLTKENIADSDLFSLNTGIDSVGLALAIMHFAYLGVVKSINRYSVTYMLRMLIGSPSESLAASWALGWLAKRKIWIPSTDEVAMLIDFIDQPSSGRGAIAYICWILCDVKTDEMAAKLVSMLRDRQDVTVPVIEALGEIGNRLAVPSLVEKLRDSDGEIREAAATALGEIGDREACVALIECLGDALSDVREAAVVALGEIGDLISVDALLARLVEDVAEVQSASAWSLGRLKAKDAVKVLVEKLDSESSAVRRDVIDALGSIGGSSAREALIDRYALVEGEDREAIRSALTETALERFRGGDVLGASREFLTLIEIFSKFEICDDIRNCYAYCLLLFGSLDDAMREFQEMEFDSKKVEWPIWMHNLGIAKALNGDLAGGIECLLGALESRRWGGGPTEEGSALCMLQLRGNPESLWVESVFGIPIDLSIVLNLRRLGWNGVLVSVNEIEKRYGDSLPAWQSGRTGSTGSVLLDIDDSR